MAWIWTFLEWTEKDMDTGHGLFLVLRAQLFSSLLLLLLGRLRLYDSFLAGQSAFTLKGEFYLTSLLHRKLKKFILSYDSAKNTKHTQNTHKTRTKHTYNLKRYTLPMQTSKKKTTQPSK
jgi:hypothetical protein